MDNMEAEPSGSFGTSGRIKGKGVGKRSSLFNMENKPQSVENPISQYVEMLATEDEQINEIEITSGLEDQLLIDLDIAQDSLSDAEKEESNGMEDVKFSDDSEMDVIDLTNPSPHLEDSGDSEVDVIDLTSALPYSDDSGVRSSVIFCSKTITSISEDPLSGKYKLSGETSVKNVDTAKKKLFINEGELRPASLGHEDSILDCSKQEHSDVESDRCPSEDDSVKQENDVMECCKDETEDDESQTCAIYCTLRCRKRSLTGTSTPKLTKKICSESGSASPLLENTPSADPDDVTANVIAVPGLEEWLQTYESWSTSQRNIALDFLIKHSTMYQLRHMMKTIEPLFQTDFISLLPKELALIVLGYLEPKDLSNVAQTCRYWRFLANDNLLWKRLCNCIGIKTVRRTKYILYRPVSWSPWKWAYVNQHMIENNWRNKPSSEAIIMRGHDDHVITCLQVYGDKIVSGSDDTTLKVWSMVTGECLQTLVGHAGGVWSCQMIDDLIVSGSTDRTLRVWDAVTGKCLSVLGGHVSTVRCMKLHRNKVVSGSRDMTLRVWQLPQGRCLQVLVGHVAAVRCVQYDGNIVISGAYDYSVKIWNPDTAECLHTLIGHTNRVYTLKYDGVHLLSGSLDTTIRVWDPKTGQCKHTLIGHTSLITSMELEKNILVSGNADATLKIWDLATGQCLHTLAGSKKHNMSVTYVQLLKRFVVSSSDDGTVKLWNRETGEFIRNILELPSGGTGGNVLRIRAENTHLVCAVGSRNGTEETKLLLMKFDKRSVRDKLAIS